MGLYDTYAGVQIKIGDVDMRDFEIGDTNVSLSDGIYFGYEGAIVIYKNELIAQFTNEQFFNKWGGRLTIDISAMNPIQVLLNDMITPEYKK